MYCGGGELERAYVAAVSAVASMMEVGDDEVPGTLAAGVSGIQS